MYRLVKFKSYYLSLSIASCCYLNLLLLIRSHLRLHLRFPIDPCHVKGGEHHENSENDPDYLIFNIDTRVLESTYLVHNVCLILA